MGKNCDLCNGVAKMYCESDQASLCWDCDGQVHAANFLVAKHSRCLLCSSCQSLTPWKATGLRLGPTFSVCDSCGDGVSSDRVLMEDLEIDGVDYEDDLVREGHGDGAEFYDDDEDEDEEYSDEDEEEAENQVVPWAAAAESVTVMSSSSSEGGCGDLVAKRTRDWDAAAQSISVMSSSSSDGGCGDLVVKRIRDCSDDEIGCSSAQESNYSRPLKRPSRDELRLNQRP